VSAVALGPLRRRTTLSAGDLTISGGVMLVVAAILSELPHQPGLPCPLRTLTGVPCPLCGMTTSVEATLHGQLGTALRANPAGVAAVAAAVALLVLRPTRLCVPTAALYATIVAMWVFELWRFALI
jgi:Protein of unknown function (DUF2752)